MKKTTGTTATPINYNTPILYYRHYCNANQLQHSNPLLPALLQRQSTTTLQSFTTKATVAIEAPTSEHHQLQQPDYQLGTDTFKRGGKLPVINSWCAVVNIFPAPYLWLTNIGTTYIRKLPAMVLDSTTNKLDGPLRFIYNYSFISLNDRLCYFIVCNTSNSVDTHAPLHDIDKYYSLPSQFYSLSSQHQYIKPIRHIASDKTPLHCC